ncbi:MAG: nuclear transport factor 2 family protein [Caulobacterales bacterium]|nr:nuclear transport factor 2 family protein [Caulobacterales bacterium]
MLALVALAAAGPAGAASRLDEAAVRAFLARQERLWNARDLTGFFATYAPDAVIADQARTGDGKIVPYGQSSVSQARAQARRAFARSKVRQASEAPRVEVAPDGRSARTFARQTSRIETGGKVRTVCGESVQTLALSGGRIVSRGQTDTVVRCPH